MGKCLGAKCLQPCRVVNNIYKKMMSTTFESNLVRMSTKCMSMLKCLQNNVGKSTNVMSGTVHLQFKSTNDYIEIFFGRNIYKLSS